MEAVNKLEENMYCCIDLKSFFASVECVDRNLDPFTTNLVVADPDRTDKTVCLSITPAMKALGVKNRCRMFEIPNGIDFITAKPRMKLYMDKSTEIYSIYLKYISPKDIHVYSIDECFIDLTDYTKLYDIPAMTLTKIIIEDVYRKTGIRATVGIGTNLFLTKLALDISAKSSPDFIGYLDEDLFKKTIWYHQPITDIWNIGPGIQKRLYNYGVVDLHGITTVSEDVLYKEFGINAELIIDHAYGIETCTMQDIKNFKTKNSSLSNGQILFRNYNKKEAVVVLKEMVEGLVLELTDKGLVCNGVAVSIGYANRSVKKTGGSLNLGEYTNSFKTILQGIMDIFDSTTLLDTDIRRINVGLNGVVDKIYLSYGLTSNVSGNIKENSLQKTVVGIKRKYGKNSLLKGISFEDGATAKDRNKMIGGHNSGENE